MNLPSRIVTMQLFELRGCKHELENPGLNIWAQRLPRRPQTGCKHELENPSLNIWAQELPHRPCGVTAPCADKRIDMMQIRPHGANHHLKLQAAGSKMGGIRWHGWMKLRGRTSTHHTGCPARSASSGAAHGRERGRRGRHLEWPQSAQAWQRKRSTVQAPQDLR